MTKVPYIKSFTYIMFSLQTGILPAGTLHILKKINKKPKFEICVLFLMKLEQGFPFRQETGETEFDL